jgi:hypothetical protein
MSKFELRKYLLKNFMTEYFMNNLVRVKMNKRLLTFFIRLNVVPTLVIAVTLKWPFITLRAVVPRL